MRNRIPLAHPIHFLAAGFGAGASPYAPGTAGTVVGVMVYLPLAHVPLAVYILVTAALFGVGVWLCGVTARDLGVHDHPGIVWDEIVGYLVTMTAAPAGWPWVAAGFVLFRLFDILKPWPIGFIDKRVKGGMGIMLDDLLAGTFAGLCLQGLYYSFTQW